MADDIVVESRHDLDAALAAMARAHRMVFFAGLPGVGKSLFIRELARVGHALGRSVHLLQWDVARPSDPSHPLLVRYPERDSIAHAMVRKVIGEWARDAVVRWHREHPSPAMLIGEVPFIGNRLVELAQVRADDAEPLLTGRQTLFATPVPSTNGARGDRSRAQADVRQPHPRARSRRRAARRHAPDVAGHARARRGNRCGRASCRTRTVRSRSLRRRLSARAAPPSAITVRMNVELAQQASVYDVGARVHRPRSHCRGDRRDPGAHRTRTHDGGDRGHRVAVVPFGLTAPLADPSRTSGCSTAARQCATSASRCANRGS